MDELINRDLAKKNSTMGETQYQILLVEDNLAHAALISRSFEAHTQYQLITKHTLNDARIVLAHTSPDLIITDFRLPDGNGIYLLEQFLQKKTCPIIVMTSFGDETIAVKAMKAGASDYIVKSDQTLLELPVIANRVLREWRLILDKKIALEQQSRLTAILEATPDLIGIADIDGFLTYLNKAGHRMLGLALDENLSKIRLADFHAPEDALLIMSEGIPHAVKHGMWENETTFISKSNEKILTSQVLITHKSAQGDIDFFSTVARD
ncbi:MAG: response regulator, partial [Gammaproteobacteria bacterium]|nr:response regulator [Gammaproteobacteria bacterium]